MFLCVFFGCREFGQCSQLIEKSKDLSEQRPVMSREGCWDLLTCTVSFCI